MVIRVPGDRTPTIILSKEGVTQGDPMAMPLYGISVAVLAEHLKREFPSPLQVWYADDFSATAIGRAARPLMKRLGDIGPSRGVFPEPEKLQYIRPSQVTKAAARAAIGHQCPTRGRSADIGGPHRVHSNTQRLDRQTG